MTATLADNIPALVDAAQHGDRDAYGRLYDRYHHVVYRFVLPRVDDHALAQDVVSETFLRAWTQIGSYTDTGHDIGAWLVTIAKHLIYDHHKSDQHKLETTVADILDSATDDHGPEQQAVTRDTAVHLRRRIRQLSPNHRRVLHLRFYADLTPAETAVELGIRESAVKALQHRATRRLADITGAPPRTPRTCAHTRCPIELTGTSRYCSTECRTTAAHETIGTGRLTPGDYCQVPDCRRRLTAYQQAHHALYCSGACKSRIDTLRAVAA